MSKIYVDELHPKTSGKVITSKINCLAQVSINNSNSQDTSNPFTTLDTAIKFNVVSINKGNVYNSSTGKFTAPSDGVYEFSWSLLLDDVAGTNQVKVFKNGSTEIKELRATSGADAYYDQTTKIGFVELLANDTLEVQLDVGGFFIGTDEAYHCVTFRYIGE